MAAHADIAREVGLSECDAHGAHSAVGVVAYGTTTDMRSVGAHRHWRWWSRTRRDGRVAAEHGNARAVFGASKGDHVLAHLRSNNVLMLGTGVHEDPLHKIVAELVASNVDEWHTWTIGAAFADAIQVAIEERLATNLETFLNDLGCILVDAILGREADDVIDSAAAVGWSTMLTDVLDAPVSELTVSDNIDAGKNLVDGGALEIISDLPQTGGD